VPDEIIIQFCVLVINVIARKPSWPNRVLREHDPDFDFFLLHQIEEKVDHFNVFLMVRDRNFAPLDFAKKIEVSLLFGDLVLYVVEIVGANQRSPVEIGEMCRPLLSDSSQ
jgi:hypothetical protein